MHSTPRQLNVTSTQCARAFLPGRAASHMYARRIVTTYMHQAWGLLMTLSLFHPIGVLDILLVEMPPLAMLPIHPLIAPQAFTPQPAATATLNPQPPPQPLTAPLQLPTVQPAPPALQQLPQPLLAKPPTALPQQAAAAADLINC